MADNGKLNTENIEEASNRNSQLCVGKWHVLPPRGKTRHKRLPAKLHDTQLLYVTLSMLPQIFAVLPALYSQTNLLSSDMFIIYLWRFGFVVTRRSRNVSTLSSVSSGMGDRLLI